MAEVHRHRGQVKKLEAAAIWWAQGQPGSGFESDLDELRDQGWDEEAIDVERAEAARLREPSLIWPKNWTIAHVFECCQWTVHIGMAGGFWMGISGQEIDSVCRLQKVPRDEWHEVLLGVRLMASKAAPVMNEKKE
ncbi:MAG: DUF1799 domain-containing protein [Dokdonella sp.]